MGRRVRSNVRCPFCDFPYEKFRSQSVPSFQEAYDIRITQSRESHSRGDYTLNAYRGTVLALMRLCKMAAWEDEHVHWCRQNFHEAAKEVQSAVLEDCVPF